MCTAPDPAAEFKGSWVDRDWNGGKMKSWKGKGREEGALSLI